MLGPRIAALRHQAGMSQSDLAEKLQVSASAVGMYEQGRREPSLRQIVALAELFQVSTDYLLTGRIQSASKEENYTRLLLSSLSQGEKAMDGRKTRPFTRQELAALMAALLTEP